MKKAIKITFIVIGVLAAAYAIFIAWASRVYGEMIPAQDEDYDVFDYFEEE